MSTILDALRKVEEEKRTRETDVRTRLLSNSARFDFRTPRRSRFPWVVASGLALGGIAFGAGLMLWRSPETPPVAEVVPSQASPLQVASAPPPATSEPRRRRQSMPEPNASTTPGQSQPGGGSKEEVSGRQSPPQVLQGTADAGGVAPTEKPLLAVPPSAAQSVHVTPSGSAPIIGETRAQYDPWNGGNPQKITGSASDRQGTEALQRSSDVVQRSPFVSSSPSDRTVAPSSLSSPTEHRATTASKPSRSGQRTPEKSGSNPTPAPAASREETLSSPPGASLSFLQWSADPERRVASIKVGTGPATLAHEGDSVEGMTVVKIRPDAVELRSGESHYLLKAR